MGCTFEVSTHGKQMDETKKKYVRRIPKPLWVRTNDYKRVLGANYIIRRNEFSAATYVVGKANRKLSTKLEVDAALKSGKLVAMWAGKFFLYSRVAPDDGREILKTIWEMDLKRGVEPPEVSDYDKESFDI